MSAAAVLAAATVSLPAGPSPGAPDEEVTGLVSISIFLAAFLPLFITLLFLACLYMFGLHDDADPPGEGASVELSGRGTGGLDAAAIAELPLVVYRDVRQYRIMEARDGDDALECSVCLHEFGDDDQLRLLPRCSHAFHPNCIAIWLEGHATCPLCRASLLDAPLPLLQPLASLPPDGAPNDQTVLLIGDASDREEEEDDEWSRFQLSVRNPLALPRSNSTGHDGDSNSTARFTLQLPEHVIGEIHRSHRLRQVTSSVESVRVREGSGYGSAMGGSVRSAVARLLTRFFAPGAGRNGDDKSGKPDAAGEEKRSE